MNKISKGELQIIKILQNAGLAFEREKRVKDFYKGNYRFDFYVPKFNIYIEFDGEQHFKFTSKFYQKLSDFQMAKERDRRKNSYCLANSIKLYRIPFWELNNIKTIDDILKVEHCVNSSFHNDLIWMKHQKDGKR